MKSFSTPKKFLGELDTDAAAELVAATSDIALILDRDGVIRDVATSSAELGAEIDGRWLGRAWSATVTDESRPKIQALLQEATAGAPTRWRQVNHVNGKGADVPIIYSAIKVGNKGRIMAVGRDLRAVATLQQRLVDAQQSVDREYSRLRSAETRNRLLFQLASEAVLVLDASTLRVVEANPAATQLLGLSSRRVSGKAFPDIFEAGSVAPLTAMLASVRAGGRSTDVRAKLADGSRELLVAASVFREERSTLLLVRATALDGDKLQELMPGTRARYLDLADASLDAFLVTDTQGKVLAANPAFLDLVQVASEEQALGESLESWLGRPGIDLNVLLAQLRDHGSVRLFVTTLRGTNGSTADVEICAVAMSGAEPACYGFTMRDIGPRMNAAQRTAPPLTRSVEQLTELVGRVPLKGIVRETSEIIERLCIEAALELTHDNRASAAEMLGLSRQSLYVKLRRYGLGDLVDSEGDF